jgi:serine/threonine protein kinase
VGFDYCLSKTTNTPLGLTGKAIIVFRIALAIGYLPFQPIVHRHLKPGNVLLTDSLIII